MSDNKTKCNKYMRLVFDFNTIQEHEDYDNAYMTIEIAIYKWERQYLGEDYSEEYIVNGLYSILQDEWNGGHLRGKNFLEEAESESDLDYDLIDNIENAYDEMDIHNEMDIQKNKLEDKLDLIFYLHAEDTFKKIIEFHDLDLGYWG